jgi:hypothetical protein
MVDTTDVNHYAETLLDFDSKIRFIGCVDALSVSATDLAAVLAKAKTLGELYETKMRYISVICFPYDYKEADDPATDLTLGTNKRVGVLVSNAGEEIGTLLGRLAKNPVQRNIGRVKDGAVALTSCLLDGTNDVDVKDAMAKVATLNEKGYITLRTHIGRSGYYFTDDKIANLPGDYSNITNQRVIDKAAIIAYDVYLNEILDEVNVIGGKLLPAYVAYMTRLIENQIDLQMAGQFSSRSVYINENQNPIVSGKINIVVRITPVGYTREITVNLGFLA